MIRDTSIECYHIIKSEGLLSERRFEVYEALFKIGPATAMQVFNVISKNRGNKVASNVYARLSELRDREVIKEIGTVVCEFTKMRVIQWQVSNSLPIEIAKKKKTKCQHCNGKGYLNETE